MDYKQIYLSKLTTAEKLAETVQNGWLIGTDGFTSEPDGFINALCSYALSGKLLGVKVHTVLEGYQMPFYSDRIFDGKINGVSWFSGARARAAVNAGFADYVPGYYRDMPGFIRRFYDYDVFCVAVSPMDKDGNFSLSTCASYSEALIEKSKRIYVEVNEKLPHVINTVKINVSNVDAVIENSHALPVFAPTVATEKSLKIGGMIADMIQDGACIQLGIGAIPDAVGKALKSKHDLGIHTELFTDSMVDLIECGAVNNSRKRIHRGKTVATMAFGSKRIYDYLDNNDSIELLPVEYVNDPDVICRNDNMISINSCVEVDLWGQVCSESVGTRHISGSGGQVDYVRGACQSKGGKSFIAFESTAMGGKVSRIKNCLSAGSIVTTSKNDVDYLVTEYGIAHLRGEPLSSRVRQLVSIAHPDFRDELSFDAKKRGMLI